MKSRGRVIRASLINACVTGSRAKIAYAQARFAGHIRSDMAAKQTPLAAGRRPQAIMRLYYYHFSALDYTNTALTLGGRYECSIPTLTIASPLAR
jgi:hypothetical protein